MPLTPWESLWGTRFPSIKEEMDKVFEDFFGRPGFPSLQEGVWIPAVDIHETKKDVVVMMDIPAIDPKEIVITVVDNKLTVQGERKKEIESTEKSFSIHERMCGVFQRTLQLPAEVVGDKAKATYKDGVLKVVVPKSQKSTPKEIRIEIK